MAIFKKRPGAAVPPSILASLAEYGRAVIDANRSNGPMVDSRFGWDFMSPVMIGMGSSQRDQIIQEIYDAAMSDPDRPMASVGAYKLLGEYDPGMSDERFVALQDSYLNLMRRMGFSSAHLTGHESERWVKMHGELDSSFDRP
jgi:hypothetical protein